MSVPMKPSDPAYFLLEQGRADPSKRSTTTVHDDNCYICRDPEFAMMGLPLCYPCTKCKGHVPADDSVCTVCGYYPGQPADEAAKHLRLTVTRWLARRASLGDVEDAIRMFKKETKHL